MKATPIPPDFPRPAPTITLDPPPTTETSLFTGQELTITNVHPKNPETKPFWCRCCHREWGSFPPRFGVVLCPKTENICCSEHCGRIHWNGNEPPPPSPQVSGWSPSLGGADQRSRSPKARVAQLNKIKDIREPSQAWVTGTSDANISAFRETQPSAIEFDQRTQVRKPPPATSSATTPSASSRAPTPSASSRAPTPAASSRAQTPDAAAKAWLAIGAEAENQAIQDAETQAVQDDIDEDDAAARRPAKGGKGKTRPTPWGKGKGKGKGKSPGKDKGGTTGKGKGDSQKGAYGRKGGAKGSKGRGTK